VRRGAALSYSYQANATLNVNLLSRMRMPPAFYYIYVPNAPAYSQSTTPAQNQTTPTNATRAGEEVAPERAVYVDYAHKNAFDKEELSILVFELATRGLKVRYVEPEAKDSKESNGSFESKYSQATVLFLINPTRPFKESEVSAIHSMLDRGGKLVMIADPTRVKMSAINSVASEFGLVFGNGYLYDLNQSDGNYRDIIVTRFAQTQLTRGVEKMVLFTAAPVYSNGNDLAITAETTASSDSEIKTRYSPMIFIEEKRVVAIGDLTFFREPFCYSADNYRFITNLAEYLAAKTP